MLYYTIQSITIMLPHPQPLSPSPPLPLLPPPLPPSPSSSFSPSFMPVITKKLPDPFNACSLVLLNLTNHVAISPNQCKGYIIEVNNDNNWLLNPGSSIINIAKVKNMVYSKFNAKLG